LADGVARRSVASFTVIASSRVRAHQMKTTQRPIDDFVNRARCAARRSTDRRSSLRGPWSMSRWSWVEKPRPASRPAGEA